MEKIKAMEKFVTPVAMETAAEKVVFSMVPAPFFRKAATSVKT